MLAWALCGLGFRRATLGPPLQRGASIANATHAAGYVDWPHLTRSLKRRIGQTPAALLRAGSEQLSFLYKTQPFASP